MRRPFPCTDTSTSSPRMGISGGRLERGSPVFGVPLDDNEPLPPVVITLCNFIEKYGLKEEELVESDAGAIEQLRLRLEHSPTTQLHDTNSSTVINVLRLFLKELPEPLVPNKNATRLMLCDDRSIKSTLQDLPSPNLRLVDYLALQFSRLTLSASLVGAAIGPSMFRLKEHNHQEQANKVLVKLIQRHACVLGESSSESPKDTNDKSKLNPSYIDLKQWVPRSPEETGRKRKEIGSTQHSSIDRKIIRSNSEERPTVEYDGELRRASSHGDMTGKENYKSSCEDSKQEEIETLIRNGSSKENVCPNREDESEDYHPAIDFRNPNQCEPVLSWAHVFAHEGVTLSPRGSFFVPEEGGASWSRDPSPPLSQQHRRSTRDKEAVTKKLSKKIRNLKSRLRERQEQFEHERGYRPSQADRITDPVMREICHDISTLRKQMKFVKDSGLSECMSPVVPILTVQLHKESSSRETLQDTFAKAQKIISDSRLVDNRGDRLDKYTPEQIVEEKQAIQRALLLWEGIHGRPNDVSSRKIISPLYDRYRTVKRMLSRSGSPKLKDVMTELQPILEHEEIVSWEQTGTATEREEKKPEEEQTQTLTTNFHEMSLSELTAELKHCQEMKKEFGRKIREWEDSFQERSGRKAQKADRWPLRDTYFIYREAKHNIRLLEALLNKKP